MKMTHYKYIRFINFLLPLFLVSCFSSNKPRLQLERQTIQEANRKEINRSNTPFDTVYIKKDTVFYWKNNKYQGKSVFIKGNDKSNNEQSEGRIFTDFNDTEEVHSRKVPFDSVRVKDNVMYYWRDNELMGETIIIRKNKKH